MPESRFQRRRQKLIGEEIHNSSNKAADGSHSVGYESQNHFLPFSVLVHLMHVGFCLRSNNSCVAEQEKAHSNSNWSRSSQFVFPSFSLDRDTDQTTWLRAAVFDKCRRGLVCSDKTTADTELWRERVITHQRPSSFNPKVTEENQICPVIPPKYHTWQ